MSKKPSGFAAEFAKQRAKLGAGKTFTYNGKSYSTNRADDKPAKTSGSTAPRPNPNRAPKVDSTAPTMSKPASSPQVTVSASKPRQMQAPRPNPNRAPKVDSTAPTMGKSRMMKPAAPNPRSMPQIDATSGKPMAMRPPRADEGPKPSKTIAPPVRNRENTFSEEVDFSKAYKRGGMVGKGKFPDFLKSKMQSRGKK